MPQIENIILSGDADLFQLVDPDTKVYFLKKGIKNTILYDEELVKEKYQGLNLEELVNFKALKGDPSDNIPGVFGIGEKIAMRLIKKFGSLENIYKELEENSEKVKSIKPKLKEILLKYKEQAFLSKFLAQINKNIPLDFNLGKCRWSKYSRENVTKILKNLEFNSLIVRLPEILIHQSDIKKEEEIKKSENLKLF
jgi:DNA polymerase-1